MPKQIKLPLEWKDLTLGELQEFMLATDDIERVSAISGEKKDDIRLWKKATMDDAVDHMNKLIANETFEFKKRIVIDKQQYGIVPDWNEFTLGEWIDANNALNDFWKNAHKLMAVLYRPIEWEIQKHYGIAKYTAKENAVIMKQMPASCVSGAMLFFWSIGIQSQKPTVPFSRLEAVRNFIASGVGITRFTSWLKTQFSKWIKSPNKEQR